MSLMGRYNSKKLVDGVRRILMLLIKMCKCNNKKKLIGLTQGWVKAK